MVLAAGYGVRMQPLTLTRPKPLIEVAGKPLIDYCYERLRAAGVRRIVVNVHYLAEQVEAWARARHEVEVSDERQELLDTGGGIAKALPRLGQSPFFAVNADGFWIDGPESALERLRRAWDEPRMDCILLLSPIAGTVGYDGRGDFVAGTDGRIKRRTSGEGLVYIGAHLVHPRLFAAAPQGRFSMNLLWDRAIAAGRLFGLVHDGTWIHVGSPPAIAAAEKTLGAR
jgi:MurNAc alpha-1-phosphate uridylyltransferase